MKKLILALTGCSSFFVGFALAAQPATTTAPATTAASQTQTRPATTGAATTTVPVLRVRGVAAPVQGSGTLTGKVLDASGKGVSGAIITYSSRTPPAIGELPVPAVATAPDGTFTMQQFPSGPRHCTLTITQAGSVVGTVEMDADIAPGTELRLAQDIRIGGQTAVPVRTGR